MMIMLHTVGTEALALGVAVAAACRMVPLHWRSHRPAWIAVFYLMFVGAIATLADVSADGPAWSSTLLLAACAAYLWHSRHTWRDGAPPYLRRPTASQYACSSRPARAAWPWPGEPGDD